MRYEAAALGGRLTECSYGDSTRDTTEQYFGHVRVDVLACSDR